MKLERHTLFKEINVKSFELIKHRLSGDIYKD